jgi:hypothetical protein
MFIGHFGGSFSALLSAVSAQHAVIISVIDSEQEQQEPPFDIMLFIISLILLMQPAFMPLFFGFSSPIEITSSRPLVA